MISLMILSIFLLYLLPSSGNLTYNLQNKNHTLKEHSGDRSDEFYSYYAELKEEPPCIDDDTQSHNTNHSKCGKTGKEIGEEMTIVFPVLGVLVFIAIIVIVVFVIRYCRNKSGMEGTYNPNREEQISGTAEMATKQKPNLERYI